MPCAPESIFQERLQHFVIMVEYIGIHAFCYERAPSYVQSICPFPSLQGFISPSKTRLFHKVSNPAI